MDTQPQTSPAVVTLVKSASDELDDNFKVDIPLLEIHPGDQVEFQFVGCENPVVLIPVENIFFQNRATDKNHRGIIRMNVMPNATVTGVAFPYVVYSPDSNIFAEGNSPPRMILKEKVIS